MKKALSILLVLSLAILSLSACSPDDRIPIDEHEHSYEGYVYDDVFHWHVCLDEGCMEVFDEEEHTLDEGECLCGYLEDEDDGGDFDENEG